MYLLYRNGIRVNCILPGFIKTPMTDVVPDKIITGVLKMIPLRRVGQPEGKNISERSVNTK